MNSHSFYRQDICRACLKELENNKFGLLDIQSLEKMFFAFTSMKVFEDDVHTKFLCEICYNTIKKFYKFREMCIKSYKILQINESTLSSRLKKDHIKDEINNDNINNNLSQELLDYEKKSKDKPKSRAQKLLNCELCTKNFYKESSLHAHLRTHKGLKPFACDECDKQFNKKDSLSIHYEIVHSNLNKLYYCLVSGCNKAYKTKKVLEVHCKRIHQSQDENCKVETSCICEECGKVLAHKTSLRDHLRSHSKELPFKCEKCPKQFISRYKLKLHCMRHDGIKNFICPYCGLKKTTKDELKTHLNYHTKEKVHKCPHCFSSYINNSNLNHHIRIVHLGIKAYSCTLCGRSFADSKTLKNHIMTHTGEKPHECKYCGKRFIQLVALQKHLKQNIKCK